MPILISNVFIAPDGWSIVLIIKSDTNIGTAIDKIKQHTRNFAKRQLTYFNNNPIIKKINNDAKKIRAEFQKK